MDLRGPTVAEAMARPANGFTLVRLLLAVAVVVSHAFSVTTGIVGNEPLYRSTGFSLGEHAVNGFFAISGFLVTMSFVRRGPADYALARALRIVPGFVAAALLVTLGLGAALSTLGPGDYLREPGPWRFLLGLFTTFKTNVALPGVFPENPFRFPMGTVWTLRYEVFCYLGVFAAGLAGLLRARWPALALAAALGLAVLALDAFVPGAGKGQQTALRLPFLFAAGAALYLWRDTVRLSPAPLVALAAATALFARTPAYDALLLGTESYGVILVALSRPLARPALDPRADLSYGVYLYGWPIQQALRQLVPDGGAVALLVPSLALSFAVAAASWYAVEKPALALKARALGRRTLRTIEPAGP